MIIENFKIMWILSFILIVGVSICGCTSSKSSSQSSSGTQKNAFVEGVYIAGAFDDLSYPNVNPNRVDVTVRATNIGTVDANNVNALITIKDISPGYNQNNGKIIGTKTINLGSLPAGGNPKVITTTVYLTSHATAYYAYLSSETRGSWLSDKKI
jgi:hypothetical protein